MSDERWEPAETTESVDGRDSDNSPKYAVWILASWAIAIIAVIVKTFLIKDLYLNAAGTAVLDDRLYVEQTYTLLKGEWLGQYSHFTLVKSPFYAMWAAASWQARVPLWLSQHALHVLACFVMVLALRPQVKSIAIRHILFIVLLFNPQTLDHIVQRFVREGIYASLSLLVMACLLGVLFASRERGRFWFLWPLGLGLSTSAMWLTREEGLWLLPSILLVLGYTELYLWRLGAFRWLRFTASTSLSLGVLITSISLVSMVNYIYYDTFCVVEVKAAPFKDAYGALTRVTHSRWQQFNSVPKETRARIYDVSPRFRELRPYLEGPPGPNWGVHAANFIEPPDRTEIAGGWFVWAFRDAVYLAGHHTNGADAAAYYAALSLEINDACDDGRLDCGPQRSSNVLPWRSDYLGLQLDAFVEGTTRLATLENLLPSNGLSNGSEGDINLFEFVARWNVSPHYTIGWKQQTDPNPNEKRIAVLKAITNGYRIVTPFIFGIGIFLWIVTAVYELARLRPSPLFAFNTALVGAMVARMIILSYISITSYPSLNRLYMAPLYAFMYILPMTTALSTYLLFRERQKGGNER